MTWEVLFGASCLVIIALSFLARLIPQRKPPTRFFKCARCNTTARHTSRTIEAWRNNKTAFFCQACHAKWLRSRPPQERITPSVPRAEGSGCLGVAALLVLVPVGIALAWTNL